MRVTARAKIPWVICVAVSVTFIPQHSLISEEESQQFQTWVLYIKEEQLPVASSRNVDTMSVFPLARESALAA